MNKTKNKFIEFDNEKCDYCGSCVAVCAQDSIVLLENSLTINHNKCNLCLNCSIICPFNALNIKENVKTC